jgi:hypothetical protein
VVFSRTVQRSSAPRAGGKKATGEAPATLGGKQQQRKMSLLPTTTLIIYIYFFFIVQKRFDWCHKSFQWHELLY